MQQWDGKTPRFVPIVSPIRTHTPEACANASMLAAALNAATAVEAMGYDGLEAVKALPGLLEGLGSLVKAWEALPSDQQYTSRQIQAWLSHYMTPAMGNVYTTLAACRTKEDACPQCDGAGYLVQDLTRPACCGNVLPSGECRSHCAVPEYYQEQVPCDACGGAVETKEPTP